MSHLGEKVTSLVDGQLTVEATERAMMHLAGCRDCRDAVEAERLMKRRLASLAGPEPAAFLVSRLLEMAGPSGPLPPRSGHVPGNPRPELIASLARIAMPDDFGDRPRAGDGLRVGASSTTRPPGRRGSSRPPLARTAGLGRMAAVSRASRNRMAAAMVGAACLVGAGVAGGVANSGVASTQVVPPVDTFLVQHTSTVSRLPFNDQTVMWGTVEAGR